MMTGDDREAAEAEHEDQEACIVEQQMEIDRLRAAMVNSDAGLATLREQHKTACDELYAAKARAEQQEGRARSSWAAYVGADAMLKASQERERIIQDHRERAVRELTQFNAYTTQRIDRTIAALGLPDGSVFEVRLAAIEALKSELCALRAENEKLRRYDAVMNIDECTPPQEAPRAAVSLTFREDGAHTDDGLVFKYYKPEPPAPEPTVVSSEPPEKGASEVLANPPKFKEAVAPPRITMCEEEPSSELRSLAAFARELVDDLTAERDATESLEALRGQLEELA